MLLSIFYFKRVLLLGFILSLFFSSIALAQTQESKIKEQGGIEKYNKKDLVVSPSISKEIWEKIVSNDKHIYRLKLIKGQYLHVTIEQKGVNVKSIIFDPDKKQVLDFEGFGGNTGLEQVFLVAEKTGLYDLELNFLEKNSFEKYNIEISELREATQQDIDYFNNFTSAHKIFVEAYNLYKEQSKDSIEKAIESYLKALSIYEKIGNIEGKANVNVHLGTTYSMIGKSNEALECYNNSLPELKKIGDSGGEANTLQLMGELYNFIGKNDKALEFFNRALEIVSEEGNLAVEAAIAFNIGKVYRDKGDSQKALEALDRALKLDTSIGNLSGKAYTLNFIGTIYIELGDNQKTLTLLYEALNLQIELKDIVGQATAYNSIAGLYIYLAEYEDALEFLNKALELRRKLGDLIGINETLTNLGGIYRQIGKKDEALKSLNEALNIQIQLEESVAQAVTLNTIGVINLDQKQSDKALTYFNKSLELNRKTGNRSQEASNLVNLGIAYQAKGQLEKALELLNQSLEIYKSIKNPIGQSTALFTIAFVKRNLNKFDQALENIKESVEITESLRNRVDVQDLRTTYFSSVQERYKFYIDLLMQLHKQQPLAGYDVQALIVNENSRARSLLDLVNQSKIDIRKGVDIELLTQEQNLQNKINEKTAILLKNQLDEIKLLEEERFNLEKEIKEIKRQLEQIEVKIKNDSPIYSALNKPKPISLEEIQKEVLDQDTVLLEYCLGETNSYLWVVSSTEFTSYQLPKQSLIDEIAKDFYNSLSTGVTFRLKGEERKAKQEYESLATKLSELLLLPATDKLNKKRILVVADGILHFIPFSTLPKPKVKRNSPKQYLPLIANHIVVNEPSISVLSLLKRQNVNNTLVTKTVGLFGDPIFGYDDVRAKEILPQKIIKQETDNINFIKAQNKKMPKPLVDQEVARFGTKLLRLEFTGKEVKDISSLLHTNESEFWLGFDASLENVNNQDLRKYKFIHFATHGIVDSEKPQFSALALSLLDKNGKEINGFLTLNEIFKLKLNAEMVTLSACQTALGKKIKGEGLVGLTQGFMHAGTKRLAVSLWNTNDQATAELMVRFYKGIFNLKLTPSEALRAAQLSIMREPKWQIPYYWAAFQLQGEW